MAQSGVGLGRSRTPEGQQAFASAKVTEPDDGLDVALKELRGLFGDTAPEEMTVEVFKERRSKRKLALAAVGEQLWLPNSNWYFEKFGSLANALFEAGLISEAQVKEKSKPPAPPTLTDEELLAVMAQAFVVLGREKNAPKAYMRERDKRYRADGTNPWPSRWTVHGRLGAWPKVRAAVLAAHPEVEEARAKAEAAREKRADAVNRALDPSSLLGPYSSYRDEKARS
jgi:hypothetical protein